MAQSSRNFLKVHIVSSRTLRDDTRLLKCAVFWELVACSKRSDSGERCRVKKAMKSWGGLGREVTPLLLPRFYFSRSLSTSHRSPLSERLEQARELVLFRTGRRHFWLVLSVSSSKGLCKYYVMNELVMSRALQKHARGKNPQITSKRRDRWSLWGYEGKLNNYKLSCLQN